MDFRLILQGIGRGSLVQFDRGDIKALRTFVDQYSDRFADMAGAVDELERSDRLYRDSLSSLSLPKPLSRFPMVLPTDTLRWQIHISLVCAPVLQFWHM